MSRHVDILALAVILAAFAFGEHVHNVVRLRQIHIRPAPLRILNPLLAPPVRPRAPEPPRV